MARSWHTPLIFGAVVGVTVLIVIAAPVGTNSQRQAAPPESPETTAAKAAVIAYFAATASLYDWRSDTTKPSKAQIALPHTVGTDQAIASTNHYIAGIKETIKVTKTTVTTDIVKTSVAGPHRITTISNVTTDWTLADEGDGQGSDASATVGHETTTVDTPAGAAVVSDTVLPDS